MAAGVHDQCPSGQHLFSTSRAARSAAVFGECRAAGASSTARALSTSAVSRRNTCGKRGRAGAHERGARISSRSRNAMPATISGVRRAPPAEIAQGVVRRVSLRRLRDGRSAAPVIEVAACAALAISPSVRSVRAASSACGSPSPRGDQRNLGFGHTQRARATASFGPKARAAQRSRVFARAKSPSCAIAMPRSASAGRVVAQRDPFQRAERISGGERPRRRSDQRFHAERCDSRQTCHSRRPPRRTLNLLTAPPPNCEEIDGTYNGTHQEWLAARLELLAGRERAHPAQRRTGAATTGPALGPRRQGVSLRDRDGAPPRSRTCSGGARSCWSITSCSVLTTRPAAPPAR